MSSWEIDLGKVSPIAYIEAPNIRPNYVDEIGGVFLTRANFGCELWEVKE